VSTVDKYLEQQAGATGLECPPPDVNVFAIVRDSDNSVLGNCGKVWTPYQNQQLRDWFKPWLEEKLLALHTGGSLHNGRTVWLLAQVMGEDGEHILEVYPGDSVCNFITFILPHDGVHAIRIGFTRIRIECGNTMAAAIQDKASKLLRIRHTESAAQTIDDLRSIMDLAAREFRANVDQYRKLAESGNIHEADLREYVKLVLDIELDKPDGDLTTRTKNKIQSIMDLVHHPAQVSSKGTTWWTAYQAVNYWLNHQAGRTADNRLTSLWTGTGESTDRNALKIALEKASKK